MPMPRVLKLYSLAKGSGFMSPSLPRPSQACMQRTSRLVAGRVHNLRPPPLDAAAKMSLPFLAARSIAAWIKSGASRNPNESDRI